MENRLYNLLRHSTGEWVDKAWKAANQKNYTDFRSSVLHKAEVLYTTAFKREIEIKEAYGLCLKYLEYALYPYPDPAIAGGILTGKSTLPKMAIGDFKYMKLTEPYQALVDDLSDDMHDAMIYAYSQVVNKESLVAYKPETTYSTTPPSNFNPPTYTKETNTMNTQAFTVVEYIYGTPADRITTQGCIDAIKRVEGEIASLKAVEVGSTKIADMLTNLEAQRDSIVAVLDAK